ncbi:RNA-binding S4 domain-containing protein [Aromatoleum toluclasticum]|uniref:RNA-binding S4 domain-containing protein n=1 Tax=Aromatoleum toluclasticum TaxID=92003 RepID=UPI00035DCFF4
MPPSDLTSDRHSAAERMRIDKWLWAARFFKTRSLANQAIEGGHVKLNGQTVKPARELRIGDSLDIVAGGAQWTVIVRGLNEQRRPAVEAQQLYEETPESSTRRAAEKEERRLAPVPGSDLHGRPTKKARRQMRGFNEGF